MGKASRKKNKSAPQESAQSQYERRYQDSRGRVEEHVQKALQQDRSPMAVIRLALAAQRTCQDTSQTFDLGAMARLACKDGCDYCCYPPVSAVVPEVANIVAYVLSQLPEAEQQRLSKRVAEVYAQVDRMTGEERAAANVACPYLERGRCSIYPVRPLACRGFNSSSKEACQKVYDEPQKNQTVPAFIPLLASAQGLKEGLAAGLEREGLQTPLVDLVRASHKLLQELDVNLLRWLEGLDVFADCQPFPSLA